MTVGQIAETLGISQPGVTRNMARLIELGLVDMAREGRDQRQKSLVAERRGQGGDGGVEARSLAADRHGGRRDVRALSGPLLDQISAIERALDEKPLDRRAADLGLTILRYDDSLARHFHDINAEWIDDDVPAGAGRPRRDGESARADHRSGRGHPVRRGRGARQSVGTCALRKTGPGQFELTKMGVLASARGRKAGEFLLRAVISRARRSWVPRRCYLLSNRKSEAAIHLYEKLGFVHDADIMRDFGARYQRCDVAMRYRPAENRPRSRTVSPSALRPGRACP